MNLPHNIHSLPDRVQMCEPTVQTSLCVATAAWQRRVRPLETLHFCGNPTRDAAHST
eukprot:m.1047982 g.1047982  ORF g.1047982 m.1047982 type:complete len:57 (+) comp24172_c0_seq20:3894-4064(+)